VAIARLTGEFSEVWQGKNLGNGTLMRKRKKVEEGRRKGKKRGRLKNKSWRFKGEAGGGKARMKRD
jgi:hypothetical protein